MPVTLRSLADELYEALEQKKQLAFLPNGKLRKILTRTRVEGLIKPKLPWLIRHKREDCAAVIEHIVTSRLKTLAVIIFRKSNTSLDKFVSWCTAKPRFGLEDNGLPYPLQLVRDHLPPEAVSDFCSDQLQFCAAVYEEGQDHVKFDDYFIDHREPIIEEEKIGDGHSGIVFAIKIAPGHLRYKHGTDHGTNHDAISLARKKFGGDHRQISSAARDFTQESRVLKRLENAFWRHEALLYKKFSVVTHDASNEIKSCSLFYELATCDLREAFTKKDHPDAPPWTTLESRFDLISQISKIVHAMMIFHLDDILHRDLKPDNILFFKVNGGFTLKVADYGFSIEIPHSRKTSSMSGAIPRCEFQGPEVLDPKTDRVGWWTDDWSLACLILWTLAYMDNGCLGVQALTKAKEENRTDRTYDTFFEPKADKDGSVELVAGVREYCRDLIESFKAKGSEEGEIVARLLGFLQERVFVHREARQSLYHQGLHKEVRKAVDCYKDLVTRSTVLDMSPILAASPDQISERTKDLVLSDTPTLGSGSMSSRQSMARESSMDTQSLPGHIAERVDSKLPESAQCTPLCQAITSAIRSKGSSLLSNQRGAILSLLQVGQSPTGVCENKDHQETPLHSVIWMDKSTLQQELVELLLNNSRGIDLSALDVNRRTPLALAGSEGKIEVCEILLEYLQRKREPFNRSNFLPAKPSRTPNVDKIERLIKRYGG